MEKDILGMNKTNSRSSSNQTSNESEKDFSGTKTFRTAREFQDFTKRTFQKDKSNSDPNEKNLPPLTKILREGKQLVNLPTNSYISYFNLFQ